MYALKWRKKAVKSLRNIDPTAQPRILSAVRELAAWPKCRNVKVLTDHHYAYRLRVGRYRVFFEVGEAVEIITIEEVKKRDDRTY